MRGRKMKVLGLDLGTNSIGWAVIETISGQRTVIDKGVHTFPKGVGDSKSGEYSLAGERTGYRAARRMKYRRKLRKIRVLQILSEYDYAPLLPPESLSDWKLKKKYPSEPAFRVWLSTDENSDKNPYAARNLAASLKLDVTDQKNRFLLGRAFYHMAQRRGFKSNALDVNEEKDGTVSSSIDALQQAKGGLTLGQFFYREFYGQHGKQDKNGALQRIRTHYTDREQDYHAEFKRIAELQQLPLDFVEKLEHELFFQRPLKSQRHNVAKCPFEADKHCAPVSHPLFEIFRMLQFINSIRIKTPEDSQPRQLSADERKRLEPAFHVVKDSFEFNKLAKILVPPKAVFGRLGDRDSDAAYLFNYHPDQSIASCPVIASFMNLFETPKGDYPALLRKINSTYSLAKNKNPEECLYDLWHVLFTFEHEEKRISFAIEKLGFDQKKAQEFNKIRLPREYAHISIKAIRKFMPLLEDGNVYSHAAFLANIPTLFKNSQMPDMRELHAQIIRIIDMASRESKIIQGVNALIAKARQESRPWNYNTESISDYRSRAEDSCRDAFGIKVWEKFTVAQQTDTVNKLIDIFARQQSVNSERAKFCKTMSIKEKINEHLRTHYGFSDNELKALFHPSAMETYHKAEPADDGRTYLGDPTLSAVKNPVFMRTMFRLRALVNELIARNLIDSNTVIHLEMARDLNDGNRRKAIYDWQRALQKDNARFKGEIEKYYAGNGISHIATDDEILKYKLWLEQKEECPYTGKKIGIHEFLGSNPLYDIEHTFPLSRCWDDSDANKTLTHRDYNRKVKRNSIPGELSDYPLIMQRIRSFGWEDKITSLEKQVARLKNAHTSTKEEKDKVITRRHLLSMELDYLKDKLYRFTATEISPGFVNRQLNDTRTICKYAKMFLETVFEKVRAYKALALKPCYSAWGIDDKSRELHANHCIDAVIAACLGRDMYDALACYFYNNDLAAWDGLQTPKPPLPWDGFQADINHWIKQDVVPTMHQRDKLFKKTKRKILHDDGSVSFATGDSARGQLHQETFYGAVSSEGKTRYVVRKTIDGLKPADIPDIVDPAVRKIIEDNFDRIAQKEIIWMNEEKRIPIRKVRIFAKPTEPVALKQHCDNASKHEYKRNYYVTNSGNYALALYGKPDGDIASKQVVSILNAVTLSKEGISLFPENNAKGLPLKGIVRIDGLVMFYRDTPAELKILPQRELGKRLYRVVGIEGTGRLKLRHNPAAAQLNEDVGDANIDFDTPKRRLLCMPKKMVAEHYDFKVDILGNITFLR